MNTNEPNQKQQEQAFKPVTDEERIRLEKEKAKMRSIRMKKKALPILIGCISAMIVVPIVLIVILNLINKESEYDLAELPKYHFYKVYDGDIMEYDAYLKKDRTVRYWNSPNPNLYGGTQITVTEETEDARLKFLYSYLQTIIDGHYIGYNACFNDVYYQDNQPKAAFTQQMLYDIEIFYESTSAASNGERLTTYRLRYRIFENNGTFRTDIGFNPQIGQDEWRDQYITLHEYSNGTILIEKLLLKRIVVEK